MICTIRCIIQLSEHAQVSYISRLMCVFRHRQPRQRDAGLIGSQDQRRIIYIVDLLNAGVNDLPALLFARRILAGAVMLRPLRHRRSAQRLLKLLRCLMCGGHSKMRLAQPQSSQSISRAWRMSSVSGDIACQRVPTSRSGLGAAAVEGVKILCTPG